MGGCVVVVVERQPAVDFVRPTWTSCLRAPDGHSPSLDADTQSSLVTGLVSSHPCSCPASKLSNVEVRPRRVCFGGRGQALRVKRSVPLS